MHNLYMMRIYDFQFITCKLSVDAFSFFYIPTYYLQNCVYLYLVPLLLHRICNLLAYVAALLVTSVC